MNVSSVYLRDLNNLVLIFFGNSYLGFYYMKDFLFGIRLYVVDDKLSYEEDRSGVFIFLLKIYCLIILFL